MKKLMALGLLVCAAVSFVSVNAAQTAEHIPPSPEAVIFAE